MDKPIKHHVSRNQFQGPDPTGWLGQKLPLQVPRFPTDWFVIVMVNPCSPDILHWKGCSGWRMQFSQPKLPFTNHTKAMKLSINCCNCSWSFIASIFFFLLPSPDGRSQSISMFVALPEVVVMFQTAVSVPRLLELGNWPWKRSLSHAIYGFSPGTLDWVVSCVE